MRHLWTEPTRFAAPCRLGLAWNSRTCLRCGMEKITKLPPRGWPWHEWVPLNGERLVQERTPPCECAIEE